LDALSSGQGAEEALRMVTHRGYAEMEQQLGEFAAIPAGNSGSRNGGF